MDNDVLAYEIGMGVGWWLDLGALMQTAATLLAAGRQGGVTPEAAMDMAWKLRELAAAKVREEEARAEGWRAEGWPIRSGS